ncbi:dynein regulatory complex protein 1 [Venturia canescens]|uniref:dynein regulatory complex protein 1 n=1 Tax=Venturia canescens TaxID=32260 RepID=UPI001C9CB3DD|nr:dynein regulatory complex protein 1 [Venturia canescens]
MPIRIYVDPVDPLKDLIYHNNESTEIENSHFDVAEEPSVTSSDPNERKLARRLRIQRRLEALKKQDGAEEDEIIEKSQTEKQIEASAEILEKLIAEGDEVVCNVKIANDARAVDRREEDIAVRKKLMKILEDEAAESLEKYQIVNEKWAGILQSKDPLDIHHSIQSQTAKCEEILKQKEAVIEELKQELENADEKFVIDQKKQSEDINLLIERIENQVHTIAKAYRKELILIEEALNSERSSLLESVSKRWDALYKKRHEEEMNGVETRKEIMKEYEEEMRRVMIDHQEKYRSDKIEFETECLNLQQEVQRIKTICLMNIEKLDYSYAVLKRREDENSIIKNQQKRRINKLQDVINGLKKNYNELEENTRLEIQKLTAQVKKAHKNVVELETKSEHFTRVNEKQYFEIWDMNESKADQLVDKILTADRIIHEQTLGLDWEPPETILLKKEDLPSYKKVVNEMQQRKADTEEGMKLLKIHEKPRNLEDLNLERKLLNHILQQISDHTGFLIEDRLKELLAPHSSHDNNIIRLDNVFQALGIKTEGQIDLLLNFFLPYSYCMTCANEEDNVSVVTGSEKGESSTEENPPRNGDPEGLKAGNDFVGSRVEPESNIPTLSEVGKCEDSESSENTDESGEKARRVESGITLTADRSSEGVSSSLPGRDVTCKRGHLLEIDSVNVTKALRDFAEKTRRKDEERTPSLRDHRKVASVSRSLTNEDVSCFWKSYRDIFPSKKEKLWDGLLIGLHKYHDILKERHRLNNETKLLRKQNAELKRLLETYAVKPENDDSMSLGPRISNNTL